MMYVSRTAVITGDVAIGKDSSVWHGAVLRGDLDSIKVGRLVSIQDNAVLHTDVGNTIAIGDRVTVGHGAIVHGCTVGPDCIVGMGAVITSRARIGAGSIIGAGAVVPEGAEIPEKSIALGVPARVVKPAEEGHRMRIELSWRTYAELAKASLPAKRERTGNPAQRVRFKRVDELRGKF
ncbi:MAG: gamma carbonic anhydrase family protein [Methanobacteriota archaeon]|nr:MAG: gamma carbonic anhydrase family protein [Euryarchaeota archaeon]